MNQPTKIQPEQATIEAWAGLLRTSKTFARTVEQALKRAGLPPLAWYDVLYLAGLAGEKGVRPFELEDGMLLEQYNISRLLQRMEDEGLVERVECPEDGRGQVVRMTAAGRVMRRRLWAVYGRCIHELVGEKLSGPETEQLSRLLAKLAK